MSQQSSLLKLSKSCRYKGSIVSMILITAMSAQAAPTVTNNDPAVTLPGANPTVVDQANNPQLLPNSTTPANNTLAAQMQPSNKALSSANQYLLSRNAQLQRQVDDLQTQTNVLVYESKGQLFLYGASTVLISLLVGIFISWLVFVRRQRW